jgi:amino acid adenylation domain-containing protein
MISMVAKLPLHFRCWRHIDQMQKNVIQASRLSPQQARVWSTQQDQSACRVQCLVSIRGALKSDSLLRAIEDLVQRHEILRTTFYHVSGMELPVQTVGKDADFSWCQINLTDHTVEEQRLALQTLFAQEKAAPFTFEQGPLLRVFLLNLSNEEHQLMLSLPSLCADGPTLSYLIGELYQASDLEEQEPLQYADVAQWWYEMLETSEAQPGKDYWNNLRFSHLPTMYLPFEHNTISESTGDIETVNLSIDTELVSFLHTVSTHYAVQPADVLLTCWEILLWKFSGQEDFLLGVLFSGRTDEELYQIPGPYAKFLPWPVHLKKDVSFDRLLAQVHISMMNYENWQDTFTWTDARTDATTNMRVAFSYEEYLHHFSASRLRLSIELEYCYQEPFALQLRVVGDENVLDAKLYYDKTCFRVEEIENLSQCFVTLLRQSLSTPLSRPGQLEIVPPELRLRLLYERNHTAAPLPTIGIVRWFEEQVQRTPQHLALLAPSRALTYAQLNTQANQLARLFHRHAEGQELPSLIGLCLPRSAELVVGILAILKAGVGYLPLDPEHPPARQVWQLQQSKIPLLLSHSELHAHWEGYAGEVLCLDQLEDICAQEAVEDLALPEPAGQVAYVLYTSGSTGVPKGVPIRQESLLNYVQAICERLRPQAGWHYGLVSSPAADLGHTVLFPALLTGGCVHMLPSETVRDGQAFAAYIRQHPLDVLKIVPSHLFALLSSAPGAALLPRRALVLGGERFTFELLARLESLSGSCEIFNHYGPTETTVGILLNNLGRLDQGAALRGPASLARSVPLGTPLNNVEVYVLDEYANLVPDGVSGELYVGGVCVAQGYLHDELQTQKRFVEHPFKPGERLYRTGDRVRWLPQGELEFMGRLDEQVKIRGHRVELGEIEAALRRHERVRECVVMLREAAGGERLLGYLVGRQAEEGDAGELRSWLQEWLPEVMVPAVLLWVPHLPLTPNGKVDRAALPEPEEIWQRQTDVQVAPRTPLEEQVARLWAEMLGRKTVSVAASFFELGGHSLLATQVISRIRGAWQVEFSLQQFFANPTVEGVTHQLEHLLKQPGEMQLPPLVAHARAERIPLSFAQQRLWFLHQLSPQSLSYNSLGAVKFDGSLAVEALTWSLQEIVQRHEVLRTTIREQDGLPVQCIAAQQLLSLPVWDLRDLSEAEQSREIAYLLSREAQQPFDLEQGPLLRSHLLRLQEQEHILLVQLHHIISDGWSTGILIRELNTLYPARIQGREARLPELPIQYADYTLWQREWLQGSRLQGQLDYWLQQLADVPILLNLPTDHPRPQVQTSAGAQQTVLWPHSLHRALEALGQQTGTTLFMTLLASLQVLLMRYSGQHDIVVGTPIANRTHKELESLIGFFANTLVLRTDLRGNPTFQGLLGRVRETALGAYAHQALPFEQLVSALPIERSLSFSPLIQVMFALQNAPQEVIELEKLTIQRMEPEQITSKFDLTFEVQEKDQGLWVRVEYNSDLFESSTIQRLLSHWQILLEGIIKDPQQRLSDLPFLSETEYDYLLREWNVRQVVSPVDICLHHIFEAQVASAPDSIALSYESVCVTYAELNRRANQLAHCLRGRGVGPEVCVGICIERSPNLIIGLLGILKAGGAYVALDTSYPPERLAFILADAHISQVVTLQDQLIAPGLATDAVSFLCLDRDASLLAQQRKENLPGSSLAEHLAYIIYTSGSTGTPKGVQVSHANVVRLFTMTQDWFHFQSKDVWTLFHSYAFDFSVWELWGALFYGGRLVIVPYWVSRSADVFHQLLLAEYVTILNQTPSAFRQLIEAEQTQAIPGTLALRWIVFGGEALELTSLRPWIERHGDKHPQLVNMYGITETTVHVTFRLITQADCDGYQGSLIGQAIPDLQLYIMDEHLRLAPVGIPGELYVGGMGLARGYLGRPDLTAERFLPHPFSEVPGLRLYRTGDVVRLRSTGELEFVGRSDKQVKIRGYRIELREIEMALEHHAALSSCRVLMHENGQRESRLIAYIVAKPELEPTTAELRRYLQEKLPDYMIPSSFVRLAALPVTPNGKVDTKVLLDMPVVESLPDKTIVAEYTPIEEILAGIWAEVLGKSQVEVHENFFEQGGHSLLGTRLISQIRTVMHVDISLRSLFESPTVSGLARQVEHALRNEQVTATLPLVPVSRDQVLPLSFAQQRLWFLWQLEPDSTAYNVPSAWWVRGPLASHALEQSMREMIQRHEALRTSFSLQEEQPVQLIHSPGAVAVIWIDLTALTENHRAREVQQIITQEARRPFDLMQGPLLRTTLVRTAAQEHLLLHTTHHSISDAWSVPIWQHELSVLYNAFLSGTPSPLPALSVQYADYACWQRRWLQGEVLEHQLAYWRDQLEGISPLELPTDRPRPPVQTFHGASESLTVPRSLSNALKQLAHRKGVTLFMLLLAAFQVLLSRLSGQEDIAVGTPIANRGRSEVEGLIGFFTNTLVLRSDLTNNPTFEELLEQVREKALGAYSHQEVPFEKLVELLPLERDLSRPPLFQVMFLLQHSTQMAEGFHQLTLDQIPYEQTTAKFDLTLSLMDIGQELHNKVEYNTDLFDRTTITLFLQRWLLLLETIVSLPQQRLHDFSLLTEAESRQILDGWNATQVAPTSNLCLHELVTAQANRTPSAIAAIENDHHLTYGELNERANQLAYHLRSLGVRRDVPVGICMDRSLKMLIGILGILKAGGAYVPLDPGYPRDHLAFMLTQAAAPVLLLQPHLTGLFPAYDRTIVDLEHDWDRIAQQSTRDPDEVMDEEQLLYIIFTSGSTGMPKGVAMPHRAVRNLLQWQGEHLGLSVPARTLQASSLSFDIFCNEAFSTWLSGGTLYLLDPRRQRDAEAMLHSLAEGAIERTFLPFSTLRHIAETFSVGEHPALSLRTVLSTAEPLQVNPAIRNFFTHLPACRLINEYGPSESHVVTAMMLGTDSPQWPALPSIGLPIFNTQIYLLDRDLHLVPVGLVGELYIGGINLARGYFNRADLTAERFVPDPFGHVGGERLYKTGDLARYQNDGTIQFLGRSDEQVKVRGYRIELGDVEAAISAHPAVSAVAVAVQQVSSADQRLVAYIVRRTAQESVTLRDLRRFVGMRLPEYMLPGGLVELVQLPLSPSGKVNRKQLPAFKEGIAIADQQEGKNAQEGIEKLVQQVWQQVLQHEQVRVQDNFFEIGGHSLLATRVIGRLRQVTGVEVPLRTIFEAPTVAELAAWLTQEMRKEQGIEIPAIVPVSRNQPLPLSFAQQRLWFLDQLDPGNITYNIPVIVRLHGQLDRAAWDRALTAVIQRHESLRTTFPSRGGVAVQQIAPTPTTQLTILDLNHLARQERELIAQKLAQQEVEQPFNLVTGSLLRCWLLSLSPEEQVLMLSLHHIITDGWSMSILTHELTTLYQALLRKEEPTLAKLPLQYADFAFWQRHWLQGETLEHLLTYWRERMQGAPPVLELPTDHPRTLTPTYQGTNYTCLLPLILQEEVKRLSRDEEVTLFMTLLAAFLVVLSSVSGQEDIVVGTSIANRQRVELEETIGFFVNTLLLRTDLSGNPSFRKLLWRVRDTCLGAYTHQDLPFELLVEALQPRRQQGRSPFFLIMFQLQNMPTIRSDFKGVTISSVPVQRENAKFDFTLSISDLTEQLRINVEYNTMLFEEDTIKKLIAQYQTVLEQAVMEPDRGIQQFLQDEEQQHLLDSFSKNLEIG